VTLLEQAARENAEWCEAVARSHGVRSRFTADAWLASTRTPASFPDAVTLRASAGRGILRDIDASSGCSVKDSFAALDLSDDGFEVLFDARWIFRAPGPERAGDAAARTNTDGMVWSVLDPADLGDWSALHSNVTTSDHGSGDRNTGDRNTGDRNTSDRGSGDRSTGDRGTFRPSILVEPGVVFLRADVENSLVAGAVLSHTGAVVGISNVVTTQGIADDALWRGLTDQVSGRFPGLAMVGYESGADLIAPLDAGFTELGDLRVWTR
jgi:hypothetical protein